jgi:hypothetical protein
MNFPKTLEEVQRLIQNQVQESLHLDYKGSDALDPIRVRTAEIAKDVSSFANSDGGAIIYGVAEENQLPSKIDDGVDHNRFSRERLEQIIQSNISPKIDGVEIVQIPISIERSVYVVWVPKSFRGPHQASDCRYYKRFNFQSAPMEDYEINDVRSRRRMIPPLVNMEIKTNSGFIANLNVSNNGEYTAENVTFQFPDGFKWLKKDPVPNLFLTGIDYFPPGKNFSFLYGTFVDVLKEDSELPSKFDVSVNYFHPGTGEKITEVFRFDLSNYKGALVDRSELVEHGKQIKESFRELIKEVHKLNENMGGFPALTDATGLSLSVPTLRNLKRLMEGSEQFEKIDPAYCSHKVFMEVLGVEMNMAFRLRDLFSGRHQDKKLQDLEGMTEDLLGEIRKHFFVKSDEENVE